MNKEPLVSVIVPVYNVEKYLKECVESVLNQTYSNFELILVNDGSTDTSPTICDTYKAKDARVKVIHKENSGVSDSRKAGVNASIGQYILFIDSDDWIDLNTLEICLNEIHKNPDIECVMFSYVKELPDNSVTMNILDNTVYLTDKDAEYNVYRRLFGLFGEELSHPERMENIVPCCGKLYKSEFAKKGKYYDIKTIGSCEDGLFNMYALFGCKKILYIDKPLYHYRKLTTSITSSYRPDFVKQWGNLFKIMEEIINEKNLDETYREALENRIALSITAIGLNELMNPSHGIIDHINEIKVYLKQEKYHNAVKKLKIQSMPLPWKLLMLSCKIKCATAVYLAIVAIKKLK